MIKIDIIAGARPNFMKIAPIVHEIQRQINNGIQVSFRLIHTGQHYDEKMSGNFFRQLNIPEPNINLGVGSGTQAEQTGGIMIEYEKAIGLDCPDVTLVVGDVTSTMAASIVAKKAGVKVVHVEGGIRSRDMDMPEEINRLVTDSIADIFYTTSQSANENLKQQGFLSDQIVFVGNTMIDTLLGMREKVMKPEFYDPYKLESKKYLTLTLHRPRNVDNGQTLVKFMKVISENVGNDKVIFPAHPRTRKVLDKLDIKFKNVHFVDPMNYLQFIYLLENSRAVITDSGGVTEEATVLGIPCMTLRDNTERPETVEFGTNELVGTNPDNLIPYLGRLFTNQWKTGNIPELWDGKASERIVDHLLNMKD